MTLPPYEPTAEQPTAFPPVGDVVTEHERWSLLSSKPLAFGGWEFVITGPCEPKRLEWWPGDSHLSWRGRPFRGGPVEKGTGKAARAAAELVVERLNAA